MGLLLGVDIGTSATKALLCDGRGKVLATASVEYPLYAPKPGWSEQQPEDWWRATVRAIAAVCRQAKVKPSQITGVGLSGQMHGSVFVDAARSSGTISVRPSSAGRSSSRPAGASASSRWSATSL